MEKRLYRSRTDRMIWGVCGGLAKYFDIDPTIVRLIAVLSIFISGLGILAYIILAIVVPLEGSKVTTPTTLVREEGESEEVAKVRHRRYNILGIILIVVGVLFLLGNLDLFWWFDWGNLWPLILVAIGVLIIVISTRRR